MKKIILFIILAFLYGCAGHQAVKVPYTIPMSIKARPVVAIYEKLHDCMNMTYNAKNKRLYVMKARYINAGVDKENRVFITEGAFVLDDESLTFILAHELAHVKLAHYRGRVNASYAVTGAMLVINKFVPGAGLLNHVINPAVVNNFSKTQEYDADKMASDACRRCFDLSVEKQIDILRNLKSMTTDAGGFWDSHPSWKDRIENIGSSTPP